MSLTTSIGVWVRETLCVWGGRRDCSALMFLYLRGRANVKEKEKMDKLKKKILSHCETECQS